METVVNITDMPYLSRKLPEDPQLRFSYIYDLCITANGSYVTDPEALFSFRQDQVRAAKRQYLEMMSAQILLMDLYR